MNGKKFVASYSSGKDSTLAVYKAIQDGNEPLGLIITYNTDVNRAWFHGLPKPVLDRLSLCLGIPIQLICTNGADYEINFEKALSQYVKKGAELCIFGDIDIEGHLEWGRKRCEHTGLTSFFPLWHTNRKDAVLEFLSAGFTTYITTVNTTKMDIRYLGQKLTLELMKEMEADGIDVCGENGEYHTLVTDGPLFKTPLQVSFGKPVIENGYGKLPVY